MTQSSDELPAGKRAPKLAGSPAAEPQHALATLILAQVNEAVVAVDDHSRVTYWGPGAERLYDLKAASIVGHRLGESHERTWLRPEDEQQAAAELARGGAWRGEVMDTLRSGEKRLIDTSLTVLRDATGEPIGRLEVNRDVTARKLADEERAARRTSEILAARCHDLREPLTPIVHGLSILDRAPGGSEQARRARAVIDRQVGNLTRLIEEILETTQIPAGKAEQGRTGPSGSAAPRAGRRVLIIEDNVDAAEGLRAFLELDDHMIEVAHDGPNGLAKARAFAPEIVLCDIGLPGMDGYGVAEAMRADAALRSVFLVALSGYTMPKDLAKARAAGFDQHLGKPPNLAKLNELLASAPPRKP